MPSSGEAAPEGGRPPSDSAAPGGGASAPLDSPRAEGRSPGSGGGQTGAADRTDAAAAGPWTAGIVDERQGRVAGAATLMRVESGGHADFDRIVFEFTGGVPGYHLEYVDRPVRQCGSGEPVRVAGDGWLVIRLEPARAHTQEGRPTIEDRERQPRLPVVKELVIACDFEAQVEWVAGVSSPNRYRAFVLDSPARLVVDIRH